MRNKNISKQSGGGGAFSSMFYSPPTPLSSEPIDILFITTHGHFLDEKLTTFESPIENIRKINTTPIGCCMNLSDNNADRIKDSILQINKTNLDTVSETIKRTLQLFHNKLNVKKKWIEIKKISYGNEIINKEYIVGPKERVSTSSPYFDSVTLLSRLPHNDLFQEIGGRSYHKEDIYVSLSEILKFIKEKFPDINNLIIVDLSCARFNSTRHNISLKKNVCNYGGYYNKIHKKSKKTNHRKSARQNLTNKNKTRKILRS